jgi:hypothetical protein
MVGPHHDDKGGVNMDNNNMDFSLGMANDLDLDAAIAVLLMEADRMPWTGHALLY